MGIFGYSRYLDLATGYLTEDSVFFPAHPAHPANSV